MARHRLFIEDPKNVRDTLNQAYDLARSIQQKEKELTILLSHIDRQRFYVRYGFKSLMGFCNLGLKFSRTQSQRITSQVRRASPTENIGQ
jgi:hypothetical protein